VADGVQRRQMQSRTLRQRQYWIHYDVYRHQLQEVIIERDLGVHMSSDLKGGYQCMESYSKASQIFGIINRTIRLDSRILEHWYLSTNRW